MTLPFLLALASLVGPTVVDVARLEAQRGAGEPSLVALVGDARAPWEVRRRAMRALGRTGGLEAIAALRDLVKKGGEADALTAAEALSLANAPEAARDVAERYAKLTSAPARVALIEALGRLTSERELGTFVRALSDKEPEVIAAAATALGVIGRRKLPIHSARALLLERSDHKDSRVRFGVAYALAKAPGRGRDAAMEVALGRLLGDADAEIRAVAASGLVQRGMLAVPKAAQLLEDPDWRVRVEAVRSLGGDKATFEARATLAKWIVEEWRVLLAQAGQLRSPRIHALLQALRLLRPFSNEVEVDRAFQAVLRARDAFVKANSSREAATDRVLDWAGCLARAGIVHRAKRIVELDACGDAQGLGLPHYERRRLAVDLLTDEKTYVGADRASALDRYARDPDPRVRAAAVDAILHAKADPSVLALLPRVALLALSDASSLVAASAADAIAERATGGSVSGQLLDALLGRAWRERAGEPELLASLMDALTAAKHAPALALCEATRSDTNASLRSRARDCMKVLSGRDPGPISPKITAPPPVDPSAVLGKRVSLEVTTERGRFEIALEAEVAPHAVAALARLARKGFYDGVVFHRVVPGFVVQGGDPTGSGMGGPGFVLPSEPSTEQFARCTVGIADAGQDTGGSQWFVMHARAPHLEGRYTWVGRVVRGCDLVDSLIVGDRIVQMRALP